MEASEAQVGQRVALAEHPTWYPIGELSACIRGADCGGCGVHIPAGSLACEIEDFEDCWYCLACVTVPEGAENGR